MVKNVSLDTCPAEKKWQDGEPLQYPWRQGAKEDTLLTSPAKDFPNIVAQLAQLQQQSLRGDAEGCRQTLQPLIALFTTAPSFWEGWASIADNDNKSLAVALRLIGRIVQTPGVSLDEILWTELNGSALKTSESTRPELEREKDLKEIVAERIAGDGTSDISSFSGPAANFSWQDGEASVCEKDEEPSLCTRSMAMVLAEQGDITGALAIYRELQGKATTAQAKKALQVCIEGLEKKTPDKTFSGTQNTQKGLVKDASPYAEPQHRVQQLLESLAKRLEARAAGNAPVILEK